MSISLGIYDIFANAIPGLFYLFVFNEIARASGFRAVDLASIDNLGLIVVVGLAAYVAGHILDYVCVRWWFRLFYRQSHSVSGLESLSKNYPDIKIKFKPSEASLLLSVLRHEKLDVANEIERNKVICILLRNISFASVLFACLELFLTFQYGFSLPDLVATIIAVMVSYIAIRRSDIFNTWHYHLIYEYSVIRGNSLQEVLKSVKATQKQ